MNSAIERLLSLRVGEIMSRDVIQIAAHEKMATAAATLRSHGVSGAPVVDEEGRCVGVISGADFISKEQRDGSSSESPLEGVEHVLVQDAPGQPYHIEEVSTDAVSNHMSTAVQTTREKAPIMDAARMMCLEHIHRLIVLDEQGRPTGVLSSLDLVAAMIQAIEE